jgi:hypothetical protein
MIGIKKTWLYIVAANFYWRHIVKNVRILYPSFRLRGTGRKNLARYSYAVFMRHLVSLYKCGLLNKSGVGGDNIPLTVAEFGPGDSLGIGLCAMLAGANEYYALDVVEHTDKTNNIAVFEDLVQFFKEKMPIPDEKEYPGIHIYLDEYSFPSYILNDAILAETLRDERIAMIRSLLKQTGTDSCRFQNVTLTVKYIVPWENYQGVYPACDWVFSQAVLEHINNLPRFYDVMKQMLKSGGISSHDIDFRSHNQTYTWNGHWAIPDRKWEKICTSRPYLIINREPLSTFLNLFREYGFVIREANKFSGNNEEHPSVKKEKLAGKFKSLSEDDFTTSTCFMIAEKIEGGEEL